VKRKRSKQPKDGAFSGSKFQRRAARRLADRIHGGEHSERGTCRCKLWDRTNGFTQPGAMDGHA
jgi:hypothetical protein